MIKRRRSYCRRAPACSRRAYAWSFFCLKGSEGNWVGACPRHGLLLTPTDAPFTVHNPTPVCLPAHARAGIQRTMTAAVLQEMTGFDFLLMLLPCHPPFKLLAMAAMLTVAKCFHLRLKNSPAELQAGFICQSSSNSNGQMRLTLWDPAGRGLSRCRSPCRTPPL